MADLEGLSQPILAGPECDGTRVHHLLHEGDPLLDIKTTSPNSPSTDAERDVAGADCEHCVGSDGARRARDRSHRARGGHDEFAWVGTGWLVDRDVVVTQIVMSR